MIDMVNQEQITQKGITWPARQVMPSPRREIERDDFDRLFHTDSWGLSGRGFDQLFMAEPYQGRLWSVTFYQFHLRLLAVARLHCFLDQITEERGLGVFLPDHPDEEAPGGFKPVYVIGTLLRYFVVGCEHHRTVDEGQYLFDHRLRCLDCGYQWGYDSSG